MRVSKLWNVRIRDGDEIHGSTGQYLGEVMNENHLITNNAKISYRGYSFTPYDNRAGYARYANYAGYAMYAGYSDFQILMHCKHITNQSISRL